jgi:hypothetical protein
MRSIAKNRLLLLGVVLVVAIVVSGAIYYARAKSDKTKTDQTENAAGSSSAENTYTPTLERIEDNQSGEGTANQFGGSTSQSTTSSNEGEPSSSFDASLPENQNASSTYENVPEGNFDQKD